MIAMEERKRKLKNTIVKTLLYNKQVRLYFVDNTNLINEIFRLNKETNKLLKLLLGETLSVVSLISGTLKGDQRINLQMTMNNPKYKVLVDADAKGNVRGYLNEELLKAPIDYNSVSLDYLIGHKGTIRAIKGSSMNQFTGITDMPNRNIADDISHHFIQSEQTQTYIKTNIKFGDDGCIKFSNAIYAQLLPGAPPCLMDEVKRILNTNQGLLNCKENFGTYNMEERMSKLFTDLRIIGYSPVQFFCGCSKEMFYGMLYSLSKDELKQAMDNKEPIVTVCHACGRKYSFDQNDIKELL